MQTSDANRFSRNCSGKRDIRAFFPAISLQAKNAALSEKHAEALKRRENRHDQELSIASLPDELLFRILMEAGIWQTPLFLGDVLDGSIGVGRSYRRSSSRSRYGYEDDGNQRRKRRQPFIPDHFPHHPAVDAASRGGLEMKKREDWPETILAPWSVCKVWRDLTWSHPEFPSHLAKYMAARFDTPWHVVTKVVRRLHENYVKYQEMKKMSDLYRWYKPELSQKYKKRMMKLENTPASSMVNLSSLAYQASSINLSSLEANALRKEWDILKLDPDQRLRYLVSRDDDKAYESSFEEAVKKGDVDLIKAILKVPLPRLDNYSRFYLRYEEYNKEHPGASHKDNWALVTAAELGHEPIVRFLLDQPGVIADCQEGAALIQAVKKGHKEIVCLLLECPKNAPRADLNDGKLLIDAAEYGWDSIVRILLESKNAPKADSQDGGALIAAARNGHNSVVRMLLEWPADAPNAICQDRRALIESARNGHDSVVRTLLECPADWCNESALLAAASGGNESTVRLILTWPTNAPRADCEEGEALVQAAGWAHNLESARLLLEWPVSAPKANSQDGNALICACKYYDEGDEKETEKVLSIVRLLLSQEEDAARADSQEGQALVYAADRGLVQVLELLLNWPVNAPRADCQDGEALIAAAGNRRAAAVKILLAADSAPLPCCQQSLAIFSVGTDRCSCDCDSLTCGICSEKIEVLRLLIDNPKKYSLEKDPQAASDRDTT